jgi:Protein of unknown function (DUF3455)
MIHKTLLVLTAALPLTVSGRADDGVQKELARLNIPAKLAPAGKQPLFLARADGTQTYTAEEKEGKLQWSALSVPDATLWDFHSAANIGTHSKGPTWADNDGSKLIGDMSTVVKEPSGNADAIAWLLLAVKSDGKGRFAKVTHVQRVDTWGGKAPAAPPTKAGETRSVHYQATYVFLGDR